MNKNNEAARRANDKKDAEKMSEAEVDENLEESFPASDAPSWTLGTNHRAATDPTKAGKDKRQKD